MPPRFVLRPGTHHLGLLKSKGFQSDAVAVSNVPEEEFEEFVSSLRARQAFTTEQEVSDLAAGAVADPALASALTSAVVNFSRMLVESELTPAEFAGQIEAELEKAPPQDVDVVRLARLVGLSRGVDLHQKAEAVAGSVGNPVYSLRFVTDLRPVYNDERSEIVGAIPLTTLRVECGESGPFPVTHEFLLTASQLDELCQKSRTAVSKLSTAVGMLQSKDVPVPSTSFSNEDEDENG